MIAASSSIATSSDSIGISSDSSTPTASGMPMSPPIFSTSASTPNGLCRYSSARVLSFLWSSKSFSVASALVMMSGVDFSVVDLRSRLQTAQPVRLGSMHSTISDGRSSLRC